MNNQLPPELFAERPVRSEYARQSRGIRPTALAAVTMLIAVAIAGIYFASKNQQDDQAAADIPTIRADAVIKERPEQPGGIDIPHQDMQIYQAIEGGKQAAAEPKIERLMPPPEEPMVSAEAVKIDPATLAAAKVAQLAQAETETVTAAPATKDPLGVMEPKPAEKVATTVVEPKPVAVVPAPAAKIIPAPQPEEMPAKPVMEPIAAPAKSLVSGSIPKDLMPGGAARKNFLVQLASINNETAAQNELKKLQAKYAGQLNGAKLRLVRADLGAKGIYYRIQSESMTPDQASKLCAGIWSQKGQCIIVKP